MELKELLDEIWKMDRPQIAKLIDVIKGRRKQIDEQKAFEFNTGDKVQFKKRDGTVVKGEVIKRNVKTLSVLTEAGTRWKVASTLLTKQEVE